MRARVDFSFEYEIAEDELEKYYGTTDVEECVEADRAGMRSDDFEGFLDYLTIVRDNIGPDLADKGHFINPRLEITVV